MQKEATLSPKGQVTLPKELRDALGLKAGDDILFTVVDGEAILTPKNIAFNELAGFLGQPPSGPATLEEIDEAIGREAAHAATRSLNVDEKDTGEAA